VVVFDETVSINLRNVVYCVYWGNPKILILQLRRHDFLLLFYSDGNRGVCSINTTRPDPTRRDETALSRRVERCDLGTKQL